jgi:hypothetical protein
MRNAVVTRRFLTSILLTLMMSGLMPGRGQESDISVLSDADKAGIVESVLQLELTAQSGEFVHIRTLSSEHIEFVAPSRLSGQGFVLRSANEIRNLIASHQRFDYVILKTIHAKNGRVMVTLSRVTEVRPCFSFPFSTERSFSYEYRKTSGRWTGELIGQLLPLSVGSPSQMKSFTGRSLKTAVEQLSARPL